MSRAERRAAERGYGLIEILVALLVLSIGLLGLARMQIAGLRSTHSASQRLEAVSFAYDVLDRMRANRTPALAGSYDVGFGETVTSGGQAQTDVEDWKAALAASLPAGDGSIEVEDRIATVVVQWAEDWAADQQGGGIASVTLRTQL